MRVQRSQPLPGLAIERIGEPGAKQFARCELRWQKLLPGGERCLLRTALRRDLSHLIERWQLPKVQDITRPHGHLARLNADVADSNNHAVDPQSGESCEPA